MSKELREIFKTHQAEENFGKYGMQKNTLEADLYLYAKELESKLKEAEEQINASKIGHNNLKIISKKQSDIIQAIKDSLMSDEEIEPRSSDNDFMEGWREGGCEQKNRTLKALSDV